MHTYIETKTKPYYYSIDNKTDFKEINEWNERVCEVSRQVK